MFSKIPKKAGTYKLKLPEDAFTMLAGPSEKLRQNLVLVTVTVTEVTAAGRKMTFSVDESALSLRDR